MVVRAMDPEYSRRRGRRREKCYRIDGLEVDSLNLTYDMFQHIADIRLVSADEIFPQIIVI